MLAIFGKRDIPMNLLEYPLIFFVRRSRIVSQASDIVYCGKEIADGVKFCKYCGFSMDESADIKNEVSLVSHTEIATAHNTEMD